MVTRTIKSTEALRQEKLKISLERQFAPSVRALLNRMIRDFRVLYSASTMIPDTKLYKSDWETLLDQQYRRVGNSFIGIEQKSKILAQLQVKQIEDEETLSLINAAYFLWSKERAPRQADFILETTSDRINEALEDAKQAAPADLTGSEFNRFVATAASAQLFRGVPGRVGAITNMETQAPAEQAKQFTARAIAGQEILPAQQAVEQAIDPITGAVIGAVLIDKEWHTVGDERVRRAHADADFQKRKSIEPFTVGGESLQYPGDTSLGASLGNVINCRCAAIYS